MARVELRHISKELPGRAGARRCRPRDRVGRVLHACWDRRVAARPRCCARWQDSSARRAARSWVAGQRIDDMPAYRRNIGLVFQDYAIFPHMTVGDNVAFGLSNRRRPRDEIAAARRTSARPRAPWRSLRAIACRINSRADSSSAVGSGTRDRHRTADPADGRAAVESRRETARRDCATTSAICNTHSASRRSTSRTTRRKRWSSPIASASCKVVACTRLGTPWQVYAPAGDAVRRGASSAR